MNIFKKIMHPRLETRELDTRDTSVPSVDTWPDISFVSITPQTIPTKWIFVVFDLPSEDSTRRVALHRQFRKVGLAMHSQSVYFMPYSKRAYEVVSGIDGLHWYNFESIMEIRADVEEKKSVILVGLYEKLIESLFLEVENKIEELAEAKADSDNTRGYTKRYKKMWERIDDLKLVVKSIPLDSYTQRIQLLEFMVEEIDVRAPGVGVSY